MTKSTSIDELEELSVTDDEIIAHKKMNDDSFDEEFNDALEHRFFEVPFNLGFIQPVWDFCEELSALNKYYEYSIRHINKYIEEAEEAYDNRETGKIMMGFEMEYEESFRDMINRDKYYLADINHEASLLMLYTLFENFLKSLSAYLEETLGIPFTKDNRRLSMVNQYISYMRQDCGLSFRLTKEMKDRVFLMRKVRNYFVHDHKGGDKIDIKRYASYSPLPIIEDDHICITYEYIISCFEIIGQIAEAISASLEE